MTRLSLRRLLLSLCAAIAIALFPGTSVAQHTDVIEAKVLPPFVAQMIDLLAPVHFTGVGEAEQPVTLSLVQVVACGAGTPQAIKLLGIVLPGEKPARIAPIIRESDCRGSPSTILKRVMTQPNMPHWVGLMELNARWSPWQLELSSTQFHGLAKSAHPHIDVRVPSHVIRHYTTSFIVPVANEKTLPVHLALGEAGSTLILNALIEDSPPTTFEPAFRHAVSGSPPVGTNAIVTIPHAQANVVLEKYLQDETFIIPLAQVGPSLTVKHPTINGSRDRYLTKSVLGLREYPDAFNLDLEWAGKDLRLTKLSLTARQMKCGTDVVCSIKRAGADALASSIGHLLKSQYNGAFLRTLILQDVLAITVNEREVKTRADVLRAESSPTDLILYLKMSFVP